MLDRHVRALESCFLVGAATFIMNAGGDFRQHCRSWGACHILNGGELLGPGPPQRDCPGRGTAWPPAEIPPGVCRGVQDLLAHLLLKDAR